MGLQSYEIYFVAHLALVLLTFIPTVVLFFFTLCVVRRRRDPARTGFTYLKAAFAFFAAFLFLDLCAYSVTLAYSMLSDDYGGSRFYADRSLMEGLLLGRVHVWTVARLCDCMADIFVFLVLERLATGVIIAKTGAPDKVGKMLKYASYGIAILLAALNLAQFGLRERFNIQYYVGNLFVVGGSNPPDNVGDYLTKSQQIEFSFQVLVFVLSLAVVGRTIMVKLQSRGEPRIANAPNFVIAASVLWLLRSVYNMAALATLVNLSDALGTYKERKSYWDILDVVFAIWPQFVLLCLAFFLGSKKQNGLWSTEQPFMKVASGQQQTPWGYGYGGQPNTVDPLQQPQYAQNQPVQNGWQPQDQQQQQYQQQYEQPVQQQGYPPQQQQPGQNGYQQPYAQTVSSFSTAPVQTRSPPPHEDAIGLNHQADGSPPQAQTRPYNEKTY